MYSKKDVVLQHVTAKRCTRNNTQTIKKEGKIEKNADSYKWTKCGVCECDQNTPNNNHTQQSEDIIQYNSSKQSHSYIVGFQFFFAFESADDDELNRFVSFGVYGINCVIYVDNINREKKRKLGNIEETMISARYYKYV